MSNEITRDAINTNALKQLREDPDAYFERTHKKMPEMFRREPEHAQRIIQDAIDEAAHTREDWVSRWQANRRGRIFRKKYTASTHPDSSLPVEQIARILGDASHGTVSTERALDIARRALDEACDNREGK